MNDEEFDKLWKERVENGVVQGMFYIRVSNSMPFTMVLSFYDKTKRHIDRRIFSQTNGVWPRDKKTITELLDYLKSTYVPNCKPLNKMIKYQEI